MIKKKFQKTFLGYVCPYNKEILKKISINGNFFLRSYKNKYPIINEIPRFVELKNYANDFGFQWKKFRKTQLDSFSGLTISEERLKRVLNMPLKDLKNKKVLEAGCGSGRFSEILLKYGAVLTSFDLSDAVEANKLNNPSLNICQANIMHMPFQNDCFDIVLCIGVLQHTPSPEKSIEKLLEVLKPKGLLAIDHYRRKWRNILPPPVGTATFLYRPIILLIKSKHRFKVIKKIFDFWFPIHWKCRKSKFIQRLLRRISPIHFYYNSLSLKNKKMFYDWGLLDTHDSLTDFYKHHRTVKQIVSHLKHKNCQQIKFYINPMDGVEGTAIKSSKK